MYISSYLVDVVVATLQGITLLILSRLALHAAA